MRTAAITILLALGLTNCSSCPGGQNQQVVVLAAASLARAFSTLEEDIEQQRAGLDVQIEISGSQTACRKISELNRLADVVATADYRVIDQILVPEHAKYAVRFASNSIVLAHLEHSKHTEKITVDNWPQLLLRSDVKLGTVDPNLAPIGYRTLFVWKLAQQQLSKAGLADKLRGHCAPEHIVPHEGELVQLLQSRAIDYAFVYRSTAEEHNLKRVILPSTYNLGDPTRNTAYRAASIGIKMRSRERPKTLIGTPITYGVTIPVKPLQPQLARYFIEQLLGPLGQRALKRSGFDPLEPPVSAQPDKLPGWLRSRVKTAR